MKKILCLLLAVLIALTLAGCTENAIEEEIPEPNPNPKPDKESYKIVFYTYHESDLWEEFHVAQMLARQNPENFIHETFPHNSSLLEDKAEIISKGLELIQDPAVKVMITDFAGSYAWGQADFGLDFKDIFAQLKAARPDLLLITVVQPNAKAMSIEPNLDILACSDLVISIDEPSMCRNAVRQAHKLDAETMVVYYDSGDDRPRFSLDLIREIIEEECDKLSLTYVEVWFGDGATPGFYSYGGTDVKTKIDTYGINTNFFPYNIGHVSIIICDAMVQGAICAQYGVPSITWLIDGVSPIDYLSENPVRPYEDLDWLIEEIKTNVAKLGTTGRLSNWPVPPSMLSLKAALEYAIDYCEGEMNDNPDLATMRGYFDRAMESYGFGDIGCEVNQHPEHDNYFMFTEGYIVF
ncbi:MAG: DUF3798 domain-containing protein [Clostridiales bacterium]|nr:DUF3798 domain-containing protein [Clostridiales bacterium]